jgi:DNA-binding response OmpR family regulator
MVKLFFETQSCEVVIANEIAEGFALVRGRFDLNTLDTTFTDGSGVELARRIRAFDSMPRSFFIRPKGKATH